MAVWPWLWLAPAILAGRIFPTGVSGPADTVVSLSCPTGSLCLLLDASGGLLALDLETRRWSPRGRHPDLVEIDFSGLLDGRGRDRQGRVWESNDGGRSFRPISPPQEFIRAYPSKPPLEPDCGVEWKTWATVAGGFLLGGLRGAVGLMRSLPGGEWRGDCISRPPMEISALRATANGAFWLCAGGRIFKSLDGGETFQPVAILDCLDITAADMDFILILTTEALYALGRNGKAKPFRLAEWKGAGLSAIAVVPGLMMVAGASGYLARSLDGGRRWTLYRAPWKDAPRALHLTERERGWLLEEGGRLWETGDGGRSWSEVGQGVAAYCLGPPGSRYLARPSGEIERREEGAEACSLRAPVPIRELFVFDRHRLLILDPSGQLFFSRDGGTNWQRLEFPAEAPISRLACRTKPSHCVFADPAGHLYFGDPFAGV